MRVLAMDLDMRDKRVTKQAAMLVIEGYEVAIGLANTTAAEVQAILESCLQKVDGTL